MFRLHEQTSKIRSKIKVGLWGNFLSTYGQPINSYLLSFFQFLFAKFQSSAGQYRSSWSLHTAPQKSAAHTQRKKKGKMDREASQTTAKSKCSQFKIEMGNTTCLELLHSFHPAATLSELLLTTAQSQHCSNIYLYLYPWADDWNFIMSFRPWLPFCAALLCTRELGSN